MWLEMWASREILFQGDKVVKAYNIKVVLETRVTLSNRSTLKQLQVITKYVCLQIFSSSKIGI